jgi:hypothetical protein
MFAGDGLWRDAGAHRHEVEVVTTLAATDPANP